VALLEMRGDPMTLTPNERQRRYRRPAVGTQITDHELRILQLAAEGHTNRAIGRVVSASEDAVKITMMRLRSRLDARDRAHAVAIAYTLGLLSIPGCHCKGDAP
jgi:DNA-binding CsgD family transcriptional regulator